MILQVLYEAARLPRASLGGPRRSWQVLGGPRKSYEVR